MSGIDVTPILLKGAAYVMAGLPTAGGRLVRDVDLLVPRDRLTEVEQALRVDGWESLAHDRYDDHYYRTWMHELPPLRHKDRGTVVDVHHAILPLTGRIHPDPELLWAALRPILDGTFRVLCPEDMVLHSAAHLFRDGELCGGLRDLTDLDSLLQHFGDHEGDFWKRLVPRAEALQLSRPLYYALRFTGKLLRTPVPQEVRSQSERHAPNWVVRRWMDCLAIRALLPESRDGESFGHATARMVMYVRSHWLRMPPWLLARHLLYKAMRSRAKRA